MTALELLAQLRAVGVSLEADGDRLRVAAPPDVLTDALRSAITTHKPELLRHLAPARPADAELRPFPRTDRTPLSPGQERLWALVSRAPQSRRFNLPLAFRVRGPLDVAALGRAVDTIIARHDVLRSVIRHDATGAWSEVRPPGAQGAVTVVSPPSEVTPAWIAAHVESEANAPFDLAEGPPIRVVVVPFAADDALLTITKHHLVADGWSFEVFLDELAVAYGAELAGHSADLAPLPVQYADVAAWQRNRLTADRRAQAERFWSGHFAGAPSPLALHRPRSMDADQRLTATIAAESIAACEGLGSAEGTTPFVVCLAAYAAYLSAATRSADVILCTPAVGRERDELQGIIGYINNVLPVRLHVDAAATFRTFIRSVRQVMLHALEWQDLPFQDIAALPETQRVALTRGMFSYSARRIRSLRLAGCGVESLTVSGRSADFDLGLAIEAGEASLALHDGVLGTMPPATFLDGYIAFLADVVANPDDLLGALQARAAIAPLNGEATHRQAAAGTAAATDTDEITGMTVGLPEDPLELQLAVIWERLFGIRPIDADDNFFDLGGHSLLAVRLLDTIEREMGQRLTLAVLAEHPTVRRLARALTTQGWTPESGTLLRMRAGGDGVPVVLLHSFEGHLFLFNELAEQLAVHHPVFGFQAAGLDGSVQPHRTVDEMARHYLSLVDAQFGDALIVIAAMCFGVSVGLEMTRRRTAAGRPTHLVLIDSAWDQVVSSHRPGPRRSFAVRLGSRARHEFTRGRYWARETLRMLSASPYAKREARIRRRTAKAWLDYTPRPYDGRVTMLRTRTTVAEGDWKVQSLALVAVGDAETVYVPGDHFTLLRAPQVAGLAAAMMAAINRPSADDGQLP